MNTTTLPLGDPGIGGWIKARSALDWAFAALVLTGSLFAFQRYNASMDGYEQAILLSAGPALVLLGWCWRPLRLLALLVGAFSLLALQLYAPHRDGFGVDLQAAETVFLLKYGLASQSAILWASLLVFLSTLFYWFGLLGKSSSMEAAGTRLAWGAVGMALIGTLVRWFESHQIAPDIGHIPVSNLYEVFILFVWLTTLLYLYFEQRFATRSLGAWVMLIVSAATVFLLWYSVSRGAHEIQPLVPALQSWWMKIHVPANFVGYGCFAMAAMVGLAYLLKTAETPSLWAGLVGVPGGLLVALLGFALLGNFSPETTAGLYAWARKFGGIAVFLALCVAMKERVTNRLPELPVLDELMYRAIALGFAFFTIATILGAFWAAEAWGGYWSWDPKETWALIVWLNYAAWLHMRLMKGLRGAMAAWWALVGLLVTTFAFIGVNMFLSGLHSYGTL
jgi:cytochrome c-type biogenesis protein CcsB